MCPGEESNDPRDATDDLPSKIKALRVRLDQHAGHMFELVDPRGDRAFRVARPALEHFWPDVDPWTHGFQGVLEEAIGGLTDAVNSHPEDVPGGQADRLPKVRSWLDRCWRALSEARTSCWETAEALARRANHHQARLYRSATTTEEQEGPDGDLLPVGAHPYLATALEEAKDLKYSAEDLVSLLKQAGYLEGHIQALLAELDAAHHATSDRLVIAIVAELPQVRESVIEALGVLRPFCKAKKSKSWPAWGEELTAFQVQITVWHALLCEKALADMADVLRETTADLNSPSAQQHSTQALDEACKQAIPLIVRVFVTAMAPAMPLSPLVTSAMRAVIPSLQALTNLAAKVSLEVDGRLESKGRELLVADWPDAMTDFAALAAEGGSAGWPPEPAEELEPPLLEPAEELEPPIEEPVPTDKVDIRPYLIHPPNHLGRRTSKKGAAPAQPPSEAASRTVHEAKGASTPASRESGEKGTSKGQRGSRVKPGKPARGSESPPKKVLHGSESPPKKVHRGSESPPKKVHRGSESPPKKVHRGSESPSKTVIPARKAKGSRSGASGEAIVKVAGQAAELKVAERGKVARRLGRAGASLFSGRKK